MDPYQEFAEIYDEVMGQEQFYNEYFSFILEITHKSKLHPKNVLELACGTGKLSERFLNTGFSVEGLDKPRRMLAIARKRGMKSSSGKHCEC